jgi:hypothetical protein
MSTFEVVLANGDRAEADTPEGILLAARTLYADLREAGIYGPKPTATFLRDGKCVRAEVRETEVNMAGIAAAAVA